MRSHETGEYQIMLDSNINIILHQLSVLPKEDEVTVTIPKNLSVKYMAQCFEIAMKFKCKVTWLYTNYGDNAGHSRDIINENLDHIDFDKYDKVESHFCTVEPRKGPLDWEYVIFNSAVLDQDRPYAEKHFVTMLKRLEKGYHVTMSCENQRDLLPDILSTSTSIRTKFFNPKLATRMMKKYYDKELEVTLDEYIETGSLFFPFRISDSCYRADLVNKIGLPIIITDPNDSVGDTFTSPVLDIGRFSECKKTLYMTMLHLLKTRQDIRIPLYEDITKNYHIGIVEMMYYCGTNIDFLYGRNVNLRDLKKRYLR